MKCEEVQSHFSDYLEKTTEGPRAKGIEIHLTGCPICREELSELLQCRELVAGLPLVDSPLGFTTRVMAHIAEEVQPTTFWSRLSIPFKIKIPLQATAVLLLGVLSLYIYQNDFQHNPALPLLPQNSLVTTDKIQEAPDTPAQPPAIERKQTKPSPRDGAATRARPAVSPNTLAGASESPSGNAESRRSRPIPVQGIVAGTGSGPDMAMPRQRTFRLFPSERELPNLGEPVPDYELYVRVGARRSRNIEGSGNSSPNSSGSASTGVSNSQSPQESNVLWYTIRQEQYEQFKNELAAQATIESEIPVGIKDREWSFRSDGPLYIKVTLLSPGEQ